jgi:ketosteroid isomerase-like protein
MSQENVELVEALYDAWNTSGGKPPLELIDPEIVVEVRDGRFLDGTYVGHAGLVELLEAFWSAFKDHRIDVEALLPAGDEVVVTVHYYGRGSSSGVAVNLRAWHVWQWRDGKAVRWRVIATREEALEAVGLSE